MGIPSYFSQIIKEYPNIIKKLLHNETHVDNFFIDSNSIVYDCARCINFDEFNEDPEIVVIKHVILKIEEYIRIVNPSNLIMISLDGTPPVAKLEQQRQRRYKSWYTERMLQDVSPSPSKESVFNTIKITTGTMFMKRLNQGLTEHFSNPSDYKVNEFVVSTSDDPGEGESKIYERIRKDENITKDSTCLIYGLDADLIMLSLNNLLHCSNTYLFRETPEFIKSIDSSLEPNENYIMDIPVLSEKIVFYMNNGRPSSVNRVQDYIFICFMLGNDFLPHFPAVNIRTTGIDKLLNAYKSTIGKTTNTIIHNNTIQWKHLREMIQVLASREEEYIIEEIKKRNKFEYRVYKDDTPENRFDKFNAIPTYERGCEKFINPERSHWRHRYYDSLFSIEIDNAREKQIANNYIEGLEWTFKYYTQGCPDWKWFYKYHYPPLLTDLIKHIPYFETTYMKNNHTEPISQMMQLCYVLPKPKLSLLPEKLKEKLLETFPEWYGDNATFHWAFCKYFWESHAQLPEIDLNTLALFINQNRHLLVM